MHLHPSFMVMKSNVNYHVIVLVFNVLVLGKNGTPNLKVYKSILKFFIILLYFLNNTFILGQTLLRM